MSFFLDNYLHLNKTYIKNYERYIEGIDMELYKTFFITFDSTKLNLFNINNPVKNRPSSRDKGKKGESCGTNLWQITSPK